MSHSLSRQARKKAATRSHIVETAMDLFRRQGFDNTTMEAVAREADVAKRTLYQHFPVKEAIVSAFWLDNTRRKTTLFERLLEEYSDSRSRLSAVFLDAAQGIAVEPGLARIHFAFQFQQIAKNSRILQNSDFNRFLAAVLEVGQNEGEIRTDVSAQALALPLVLSFTAVCLQWFDDMDGFDLEETLGRTVDCFLDGAVRRD